MKTHSSSEDLIGVATDLRKTVSNLVATWKAWSFTEAETKLLANIVGGCMSGSVVLLEMALAAREGSE